MANACGAPPFPNRLPRMRTGMVTEPILVEEATGLRRGRLVLTNLSGRVERDTLSTVHWNGTLLLGE